MKNYDPTVYPMLVSNATTTYTWMKTKRKKGYENIYNIVLT